MRPVWHPAWIAAALAGGALAGGLSDRLTAGPYFDLLSPVFWGLLVWNLLVYLALLVPSGGRVLPRLLARLTAPVPVVEAAAVARAAALLHAAAAGWALGLGAGLVLRGLVADYRAGWATTLLPEAGVQALLHWGFEPARSLLGLAPPEVAAVVTLRVVPGQVATESAASWIALMVVQLALWVALPRLVLTALAVARAAAPPAATRFWVLPHGAAPAPQAVAALQALLAARVGSAVSLQVAAPLPWGDEHRPPSVPPGLRPVVLVDLAATPEAEVHGRLLQALAGQRPLVVADESGFVRRFGRGERLAQRQAAWRALVAPTADWISGAL